jgi:hypothetical protein
MQAQCQVEKGQITLTIARELERLARVRVRQALSLSCPVIKVRARSAPAIGLAALSGLIGAFEANRASAHGRTPHHAHCVRVRLGRRIDCLAEGKPCEPRYEHIYERRGFRCERGRHGRYRLGVIHL